MYTILGRYGPSPRKYGRAPLTENIQSLTYGRPPSLAMAHIDCKMAHDTTKNAAGHVEMSCQYTILRFLDLIPDN